MRLSLSLTLLLTLNFGCTSRPDSNRTAQLADKLVTCQNERDDLVGKLQVANASIAQAASEAAKGAKEEDGAQVPSGEKGPGERASRAGRAPSAAAAHRNRRSLGEVAAVRPAVQGSSRATDNPAAEEREAAAVAQTLRSRSTQFRPCYERGLKRNSNLQFTSQVKIHLTVSSEGKASNVRLTPKTDGEMESCISQVIARWPFPPYKGQPVVVEVPVSLRVQGQ